jgi:hypothetical protein
MTATMSVPSRHAARGRAFGPHQARSIAGWQRPWPIVLPERPIRPRVEQFA